tara:strand:- start:6085 stop:6486 length:402 start_codon:yes stop_codon:yes gene_type:complete
MKINFLPEVLVGEIFSFISLKNLAKCNKSFFNKYYLLKNKNKEKIKQSYFRFLLRNDMNFIFEKYIDIKFAYFIKNKKIIYKDKIFPRKIELLRYLTCFVFESPKCKKIIENHMKKNKLVFKKIKLISNKWTN